IADSDVQVPCDYLERVIAPLADEGVGIVTCPYRGAPRPGLWSLLGSMFVNEWFMPSVRVAALLGSREFAFGATIALRRESLERGTALAVALLAVTAAARVMIDSAPRRSCSLWMQLWVIPLADLLAFALWCWSFATREVEWRHTRYRVARDGTAQPLP